MEHQSLYELQLQALLTKKIVKNKTPGYKKKLR